MFLPSFPADFLAVQSSEERARLVYAKAKYRGKRGHPDGDAMAYCRPGDVFAGAHEYERLFNVLVVARFATGKESDHREAFHYQDDLSDFCQFLDDGQTTPDFLVLNPETIEVPGGYLVLVSDVPQAVADLVTVEHRNGRRVDAARLVMKAAESLRAAKKARSQAANTHPRPLLDEARLFTRRSTSKKELFEPGDVVLDSMPDGDTFPTLVIANFSGAESLREASIFIESLQDCSGSAIKTPYPSRGTCPVEGCLVEINFACQAIADLYGNTPVPPPVLRQKLQECWQARVTEQRTLHQGVRKAAKPFSISSFHAI